MTRDGENRFVRRIPEIQAFIDNYGYEKEGIIRLVRAIDRLDILNLKALRARHNQRIGQWLYNFTFDDWCKPLNATVGFSPLFHSDDAEFVRLVVLKFIDLAAIRVIEATKATSYFNATNIVASWLDSNGNLMEV